MTRYKIYGCCALYMFLTLFVNVHQLVWRNEMLQWRVETDSVYLVSCSMVYWKYRTEIFCIEPLADPELKKIFDEIFVWPFLRHFPKNFWHFPKTFHLSPKISWWLFLVINLFRPVSHKGVKEGGQTPLPASMWGHGRISAPPGSATA